jgi:hypothetical protein
VSAAALLWTTTALFLLRVVGQIEVWLLAPDWLPPMQAWYSGLLPYPLLLPAQILLLMLMAVLAYRRTVASPHAEQNRGRLRMLRGLALAYVAVMALRLVWTLCGHGAEFYLHGGIPIAFHWVLALFLLVYVREQPCATCSGGTAVPSRNGSPQMRQSARWRLRCAEPGGAACGAHGMNRI